MEKAYRDEAVYGLAELFKIFGDPTRIRILYEIGRASCRERVSASV